MTSLAFSTLGCPGLPLARVADLAVRHGFSGVELRAADGEPVHIGLDPSARRDAAAALAARRVLPLSVASYVRVAASGPGKEEDNDEDNDEDKEEDEEIVSAGIAHGRLAADLGAPFLRVFPGGPVRAGGAAHGRAGTVDADRAAVRRLCGIRDGLADTGVTVALETHDSHPRGTDIARLLDRCPGVMAIWDVLHTWRAGEPAAETLAAVGTRLAFVQVKDVVSRADPTPLPPGDGALPLAEVAEALRAIDYRGWVSWEYERAWFPRQPELSSLAGRVAGWMRATVGAP